LARRLGRRQALHERGCGLLGGGLAHVFSVLAGIVGRLAGVVVHQLVDPGLLRAEADQCDCEHHHQPRALRRRAGERVAQVHERDQCEAGEQPDVAVVRQRGLRRPSLPPSEQQPSREVKNQP